MLGQFFGFQGRVTRGTWWIGYVFSVFLVAIAWMLLGVTAVDDSKLGNGIILDIASLLCSVAAFAISISVTVKRYHDRNKSGIWWLIGFIPILNFWQWVECGFCIGDEAPNRFGPAPGSVSHRAGSGGDNGDYGGGNVAMAKLDDDYMAEYARKIALQQAEAQEKAKTTQPSISGGNSAPVFGKR